MVGVESDCLQPGEPLAAVGAADENRQLIIDQPAAATGKNRRSFGQTRPLPMAAVSREPSHSAAVREHGAKNRSAATASRIAGQKFR